MKALLRKLFPNSSYDEPLSKNFDRIKLLHECLAASEQSRPMDDQTWHDLELPEMFSRLDYFATPLGQQLLYHRLRSQSIPAVGRLAIYQSLAEKPDVSERFRQALRPLRTDFAYQLVPWLRTFRSFQLPHTPLLLLLAILPFVFGTIALLQHVYIVPTLIFLGINFAISRWTSPKIHSDIRGLMALNNLLACNKSIQKIDGANITRSEIKGSNLKVDLAVSFLVSEPHYGYGTLFEYAIEYLNVFALFELIAYSRFSKRIERHRELYLELVLSICELDLRLGLARYLAKSDNVVVIL